MYFEAAVVGYMGRARAPKFLNDPHIYLFIPEVLTLWGAVGPPGGGGEMSVRGNFILIKI
jgi:hypothetical protein